MKKSELRQIIKEEISKVLKERVSSFVNKILRTGGYDEIDDPDLLKTVEKEWTYGMNAKDVNDLAMSIEDREGGNIDFSGDETTGDDREARIRNNFTRKGMGAI